MFCVWHGLAVPCGISISCWGLYYTRKRKGKTIKKSDAAFLEPCKELQGLERSNETASWHLGGDPFWQQASLGFLATIIWS